MILPSPVAAGLRHGALLLATLLLGACARGAPPGLPAPMVVDFTRVADSIVSSPPLHRAHIGIVVYDPVENRVLYARNAQRHFVPASNQKYWPTAAALHLLGPGYRYRTPVSGIGFDRAAGTARALVVEGRGDPTWSRRFHEDDLSVLGFLADSLVAAGLRRVTGDLVIDASWFDESLIPGSWTFGNLNGTSAPPTGAFVVAEGIMAVMLEPGGAEGAPAQVTPMAPQGVVPLRSTLLTGAADTPRRVSSGRGPWSDTLRLSGVIPVGGDAQALRLPMTDPVRLAAEAFGEALRERGIVIEGAVRVVHDPAAAAALREGRPGGGSGEARLPVTELASWSSPPMSEIVTAVLQPSQNWIAEQLVRTLGAERGEGGGWRAGIEVQESFLFGTVGIDPDALRMQDGSGMSHQNLVTPWAVVQLLDHARTAAWGPVFREALTGPGRPGTLSNRLGSLGGRVTGKTGTLSNVNALSGYVVTRDGRELIFSILSNASGLGGAPVVSAIDRMVETLANGAVPR